MSRRTRGYAVLLLAVIVLTALNAFQLKALDVIGIPMLFAAALLGQLLLVILFAFALIMVLRTPLSVVGSILVSAWHGGLRDPYVVRFRRRHPRLTDWAGRRFSRSRPSGLILTVGAACGAAALVLFIGALRSAMPGGSFAGIDRRVLNLVPDIRTDGENAFFAFVTFAASSLSVLAFLVVVAVAAWRRRQWWLPLLLATGFGLESAVVALVKVAVGRPRPDRSLALMSQAGFSFPSGHTLTATVMCGLTAYLVVRAVRPALLRLLVLLAAVAAVLLVGLSRVYFGVHYPSDVMGSAALGMFLLACLITPLEINERFHRVPRVSLGRAVKGPVAIGVGAVLVFGAAASGPLTPLTAVPRNEPTVAFQTLDQTAVGRLPIYSETLTGARMEPINFIFVGSQEQVEDAFRQGGWYKADRSTLGNTLEAILVAVRSEQYLTAPVTPSYLDGRPETVAFERPTDANTLAQRHYTRLWRTDVEVSGQPVWVATASFDRGVGFARSGLPTHHIDPNVDAERAYILQTLGARSPRLVQITDPQQGQNASGDGFFTDGRAAVLELPLPGQ